MTTKFTCVVLALFIFLAFAKEIDLDLPFEVNSQLKESEDSETLLKNHEKIKSPR